MTTLIRPTIEISPNITTWNHLIHGSQVCKSRWRPASCLEGTARAEPVRARASPWTRGEQRVVLYLGILSAVNGAIFNRRTIGGLI